MLSNWFIWRLWSITSFWLSSPFWIYFLLSPVRESRLDLAKTSEQPAESFVRSKELIEEPVSNILFLFFKIQLFSSKVQLDRHILYRISCYFYTSRLLQRRRNTAPTAVSRCRRPPRRRRRRRWSSRSSKKRSTRSTAKSPSRLNGAHSLLTSSPTSSIRFA